MKLGGSNMKKIFYLFLILVFMFSINNSFAQYYKISDAGTAGVNGIYVENGTHGSDNRPKYDHVGGTYHIYHDFSTAFSQSFWNIDDDLEDEVSILYWWTQPNPAQTKMPAGIQWSPNGVSGTLPNAISVELITTFEDGTAYSPPNGTPGTTDNPIGMFKLTSTDDVGVLKSVTVDLAGTRSNVSNVKLWSSTDATFGTDTQLGSSVGDNSTVTFSGFSNPISTTGSYYFVTVDLAANATGDVTASIPSEASFSLEFTNAPSAFTNAPLSGAAVPLPVELTAFSANIIENSTILNWETETEVNNYGFDIERQILKQVQNDSHSESNLLDEESWEKIAFVEGHGNSNSPKIYSFEDKSITASGKYNYRLKQIDIDGTFEYSDQIEIEIGIPTNFEVKQNYPNPFNPTTTITFSINEKENVTLQIFNMLGEVVETMVDQQLSPGKYNYEFDASRLSSGNYFYRVVSGKNIAVRKMVMVK